MNWGVAIFGGVLMIALGYYAIHARKVYTGPVTGVKMMQQG